MRRRPLVRGSQTSLGATPSSLPARAGWMRGVRDHHGRVGGQGIQQFFASGDEGFRLCFVEPAGNDFRLVIFETQTMRRRNQSPFPKSAMKNYRDSKKPRFLMKMSPIYF